MPRNFNVDLHPPFSTAEKKALVLMREDYPEHFNEDGTLDELGQFYWREKGRYYLQVVLPEQDITCSCGCTVTFDAGENHARCFNTGCGEYHHR